MSTNNGLFAQKVQDRMLELTFRDSHLSLEYLRKIVRGEALPSKQAVLLFAQILELDEKELQALVAADRKRQL